MQPDQTAEAVTELVPPPPPTFGTLPGVASLNSVYASDNCGEDCGLHPLDHKGASLDGTMGWGDWDEESRKIAQDYAAGGFGGVNVGDAS